MIAWRSRDARHAAAQQGIERRMWEIEITLQSEVQDETRPMTGARQAGAGTTGTNQHSDVTAGRSMHVGRVVRARAAGRAGRAIHAPASAVEQSQPSQALPRDAARTGFSATQGETAAASPSAAAAAQARQRLRPQATTAPIRTVGRGEQRQTRARCFVQNG